MAYWMRIFRNEGKPPPLEVVFSWVAERGPTLALDSDLADVDSSSNDWQQAAVQYRPGKRPFLVEVSTVDQPEAQEELEEFIELLDDVLDTPAKDKVLAHLNKTTFVVANQISTSDFEDDGFDAVGEFMRFFVEHNGGMIQADGEGFYEGERLLLPLA